MLPEETVDMQTKMPLRIGCQDRSPALVPEICRQIGSSFAGDILIALNSIPECLAPFWISVCSIFEAGYVQSAAQELRHCAFSGNRALARDSNHLAWLTQQGYSREDIRQIRYVVEVFHSLEPVFAVIGALALRWVRGPDPANTPGQSNLTTNPITYSLFTGPIEFASESCCAEVLDDFARLSGRPIHLFYRALAIWPEYAQKVWNDIGSLALSGSLSEQVGFVNRKVEDLSGRILLHEPVRCPKIDSEGLIQRCVSASGGVIVIASAMRRIFTGEETRRRVVNARSGAL